MFRAEHSSEDNSHHESPVESLNLSNSAGQSDSSPPVESTESENESPGIEESKKIIRKNKGPTEHIETIQPDINIPSGSNTSIPKRRRTKLIQKPKLSSKEREAKNENLRAQRREELRMVKKEDIEKIYEQKNYAYLRAEDMKKLRLFPRRRPPITEPETTPAPTEKT